MISEPPCMRLLSVREATKPLPSSSDPEVGYACPPPWLPSLPQRHHPTSREAATAPGCLCWGPGAAALDRACLPLSGPAGRRLQALSSLPPSLAMVSRLVGGWAMAGWLAGPPGRLVVRTDPPPARAREARAGPPWHVHRQPYLSWIPCFCHRPQICPSPVA